MSDISQPHIMLTAEQAQSFLAATGAIELRDPSGKPIGIANASTHMYPHGWTDEDLSIVQQRKQSPGSLLSLQEVLANLNSLEAK